MYSMTGFGQGTAATDGREMKIELRSVNHRFLDVSMRLPRKISFLETDIRGFISKSIKRGHVDVFVSYTFERDNQAAVKINGALLSGYMEAVRSLDGKYAIDTRLDIATLTRLPDVITLTEEEDDKDAIRAVCKASCEAALTELTSCRAVEGKRLIEDMSIRLDAVQSALEGIIERAPLVPGEYRQRLEQRISEWLGKGEVDPARLAAEVAFFADRCNIDEEITRLKSHIKSFKALIKSGSGKEGIGRKLDFTLQEMNREANTIGSKANDITITDHVMEIKGELEKIREQAQNIE